LLNNMLLWKVAKRRFGDYVHQLENVFRFLVELGDDV